MTDVMAPSLPALSLIARLGAAAVLGGLVGLERERLERAAGLRTHALVAVASALMMIVSAYGFSGAVPPGQQESLDPSRMAAQVVSGIGFLGAGVIIFQKNRVRGLDTAASLWGVTGIGLAAGGGLYLAAGAGALFILGIQATFQAVERRFFLHHQEHRLALEVERGGGRFTAVERALASSAIRPKRVRLREDRDRPRDRLELDLPATSAASVAGLLDTLRAIEGVRVTGYTRESSWTDVTDLSLLALDGDDIGPLDDADHADSAFAETPASLTTRRLEKRDVPSWASAMRRGRP